MPLLETYMAERGWRKPARVLLTHRHQDHLGGVKDLRVQFPGSRVQDDPQGHRPAGRRSRTCATARSVEADGVTLVPVHTPGHASDHLCYYLPEDRALFTGDVVLGGSTTVIPEGDGDLVRLHGLAAPHPELDVERIYPAHGPVIEDGQGKIQEYIDHRLERERQILEAMGTGRARSPRW